MISADALTEAQRRVYDKVVSGPRGKVVGPLRAALHSPELASRWQELGEFLRFNTVLSPELSELAIIVVGRAWDCQVEWFIHAGIALRSGVDERVIHAINLGDVPVFADATSLTVYEYARVLVARGRVPDTVYAAAFEALGTVGLVELTALIGYYTMVAMTLNAHGVPIPDGDGIPLRGLEVEDGAPTRLPAGKLVEYQP